MSYSYRYKNIVSFYHTRYGRNEIPVEELASSALIVCSNVISTGDRENDFLVLLIEIAPESKSSVMPGWLASMLRLS